ncbi:hypothetical protein HT576_11805 [Haloterrigena sp. SYSU A121-1]|uniref:Uncharacterized protein n=1 Tax=Haloterrigena gelatinilytica TaxID=2741724 RepID=A0A8J8GKI8_9EURY|nr:hypothetical protein [Haloterrigena gelatinilytica]NUB91699.1 hypothetical protein [Haloterrigena gelatinilytica]
MNRRSLLAGVAASGTAIAGCASIEATVFQESTTPEVPSDPDDPIARATIGSPTDDDSPHRVRLWNRTDEQRSIGLDLEAESATFEGDYDLEPDAHVVIFLHDQAEYAVTVTVDGDEVESTTLEADSFDDPCPSTELFVLADDEFETTTEPESNHC